MFKKGTCHYCRTEITIDTNDKYVQCDFCSGISEIKGDEKRQLY